MLTPAPFLAGWAVIMVAVPIAYSYRYILMVAMACRSYVCFRFARSRISRMVKKLRQFLMPQSELNPDTSQYFVS